MRKNWLYVIVAVCVLIKFINLLGKPIYLDEGLYIFWAKLFWQNHNFAYVSLQDGKTPLYMWMVSWVYPIFKNFLLTARVLSVVAGTVSLISWYFISNADRDTNFKKRVILLISLSPLGFVIERMALVDSLLTAFFSLATLFLVKSKQWIDKRNFKISLFYSFLAGISLGFSYLTKTTTTLFAFSLGVVSIYWLISYLLNRNYLGSIKLVISNAVIFLCYSEIVGYLKVGAHRFWGMIANKETDFVYTPLGLIYQLRHYLSDSVILYQKNLLLDLGYLISYFGLLLPFLVLGFIYIIKHDRSKIWSLLYLLTTTGAILIFAKVTASRYFYPLVPVIAYIAAEGLGLAWQSFSKFRVLISLCCVGLAVLCLLLVFIPEHALYSADDFDGFYASGNSTYGLNEVISDFDQSKENSMVGVTGIWGVGEGAVVELGDNGIESVVIDESGCRCGKLDLSKMDRSKVNRYLYITRLTPNIKGWMDLYHPLIVKEFIRPESNSKAYLLRI